MTLAAVFVLYGMIELVHGSAPMAALTFGVFMTNADKIAAIFGKEYKFTVDEGIRRFNTEISFFVRTFFFVYMGLVVSFAEFDAIALAAAGAAAGALLLVRRLVLAAERAAGGRVGESAQVFAALVPRGLTSAVLVSMTLQAKVPGGERFLVLTFAVILLTNFYMTWRLYSAEKSLAAA
jgi:cell volume regulation protein A